ncbi:MATE family efflux transporter [Peptoniphilus indolicus]|nr:MATE family efflux transporter [Peptoniphilus indolicus]SUB74882.1 Multidrug export protein mepA [Peptoniphilus indolicus]
METKKFLQKFNLTEGTVWKIMLQFAMPIFLGTLFQSLYTTVDAIIIGRFAGKEALASIESVFTLTKMPINFFAGLASGATIIISQYYGAKKNKEVSDASHNAMLFAFVGGIALTVIGCILSPFAIKAIRVPNEIVTDAQRYIFIYFSGIVVSMLYNVGAGILRALGNSKTPFYFLIAANFLNVILDLIFVAFFRLGVVGAAIATVFSQCLSTVLIVVALTKTKLPCQISFKNLRFHKIHVIEIFKLGLPIGIQSVLYPLSNTIVQASINSIGVDSIAAWAVCGKLDFLIWAISDAFSVAVATFVAQNYGAQKYERARNGVRVGLIMALTSISVVSCVLYFCGEIFAQLLIDDENVIFITSQIMHFIAPLYLIYVFCDILPGAIRGTGDTFRPMVITLLGTCISRILWVLFIVPLNHTLITVLSCYPISWGITAFIYIVYYIKRFSRLGNKLKSI